MRKKEKEKIIDCVREFCRENEVADEYVFLGSNPEDFASAILGVIDRPIVAVVYSYEKVIRCFMKLNNWSIEDAEEWYDYNVDGAFIG